MDEADAQRVASTLRRLGIRGVVSPEDLDTPNGQWRVYDSINPVTRRDITDEVRAIIRGMSRKTGPTRGFVVPIPH
ncbi:hypothetical protein [Kitasatospora aureofaciens]|uniref:hypothetical protein n=1 Tax=Kitasatospora aureofaciens TaxID=1894 RepID=UPI001C46C7F8|nr:hypothetical protein [Kitasatospora aureofaciens]